MKQTVPEKAPPHIATLRLGTDFYEATLHELKHLYPRLEKGGVPIIDDYGAWRGCRKAVDEYFQENNINVFMNRVDSSCRLIVKP